MVLLIDNLGTIVISIILLFIIIGILFDLFRKNRGTDADCGGSCGSCPQGGGCCFCGHSEKIPENDKKGSRKMIKRVLDVSLLPWYSYMA